MFDWRMVYNLHVLYGDIKVIYHLHTSICIDWWKQTISRVQQSAMRESASQSQRFWKMRVFSENEMCASLIEQRLFLFASAPAAALASSAGTEAPDRTAAIERLREDDCSCAAGASASASARVWASRSGGTLRAPALIWTLLREMTLSPAAGEPLLFAAIPFLLLLLLLLLLAAGVPLGLELLLEFGTAFCSAYRSTNETSRFWAAETSRTHDRWIRKRALGVLQAYFY